MFGTSSKKFMNGKFAKVELEFSDKISRIQISGDFFLIPEETLEKIEESLIGEMGDFEKIIEDVLEENQAQLLGFTPLELSQLIKEAMNNE